MIDTLRWVNCMLYQIVCGDKVIAPLYISLDFVVYCYNSILGRSYNKEEINGSITELKTLGL